MIIASKTMFKISLLGWELCLLRYPKIKRYEGERNQGLQPDGAYIKKEGNFLIACDKNGNHINVQRSLTINDGVDGPSTIIVEYFFAGIYEEPITAPPLTEEEKKFVDRVPIDAKDINRTFNHG